MNRDKKSGFELPYPLRYIKPHNPVHYRIINKGAGFWNKWHLSDPNCFLHYWDKLGADETMKINSKSTDGKVTEIDCNNDPQNREVVEKMIFDHLSSTIINLNGVSLKGLDLAGIQVGNGNFIGANFEGCNLEGARFICCNLRFANFKHTNLKDAEFDGSFIEGLDLRESNWYSSMNFDYEIFNCSYTGFGITPIINDHQAEFMRELIRKGILPILPIG